MPALMALIMSDCGIVRAEAGKTQGATEPVNLFGQTPIPSPERS